MKIEEDMNKASHETQGETSKERLNPILFLILPQGPVENILTSDQLLTHFIEPGPLVVRKNDG